MVKSSTMTKVWNEERQFILVEITLGRRLLSIILTAFLPTVLLNLIGHTANYFKGFFFEAVISVNVTVMLVLTTMFINISNNLPKTAYIKMIDIWLLFNLFKPFVDIFMQTYIETLKVEDEPREINHHGKTKTVGKEDCNEIAEESEQPKTSVMYIGADSGNSNITFLNQANN